MNADEIARLVKRLANIRPPDDWRADPEYLELTPEELRQFSAFAYQLTAHEIDLGEAKLEEARRTQAEDQ